MSAPAAYRVYDFLDSCRSTLAVSLREGWVAPLDTKRVPKFTICLPPTTIKGNSLPFAIVLMKLWMATPTREHRPA